MPRRFRVFATVDLPPTDDPRQRKPDGSLVDDAERMFCHFVDALAAAQIPY